MWKRRMQKKKDEGVSNLTKKQKKHLKEFGEQHPFYDKVSQKGETTQVVQLPESSEDESHSENEADSEAETVPVYHQLLATLKHFSDDEEGEEDDEDEDEEEGKGEEEAIEEASAEEEDSAEEEAGEEMLFGEDPEEKVKQMTKRWKSIKDHNRQELKIEEQESRNSQALRETEDSLKPADERETTEFPVSTDTESEIGESQVIDTSLQELSPSPSTLSTSSERSTTSSHSKTPIRPPSKLTKSVSRSEYDRKILSFIDDIFTYMKKDEEFNKNQQNSCYQFLMSILPDLERVPEKNKFAVRKAIMDCIDTYRAPGATGAIVVEDFGSQHSPYSVQQPYPHFGHGN